MAGSTRFSGTRRGRCCGVRGRRGPGLAYVKRSGQYRLQGDGHANLYQLFFERGLGLLGPDGRCGVILPAGFASDQGTGILRRHLLDHAEIETFTIIDNSDGIFPIHRALKFLLLTFRSHGTHRRVCREERGARGGHARASGGYRPRPGRLASAASAARACERRIAGGAGDPHSHRPPHRLGDRVDRAGLGRSGGMGRAFRP